MKKGQLTPLMILSIIIVAVFAALFYITGNLREKSNEGVEVQVKLVFGKASIQSYIEDCIRIKGEEALTLLGRQGGYINLPTNQKIAYYYNKGINEAPSLKQMEDELSSYINNNLNSCLKDFKAFKEKGWDVAEGNLETAASINKEDVVFKAHFPIKIKNPDIEEEERATIELSDFIKDFKVRLQYIHNIANQTANFHIANPGWTDFANLSRYDVNITIFPYNGILVYSIDDPESIISKKAYRLMFGVNV